MKQETIQNYIIWFFIFLISIIGLCIYTAFQQYSAQKNIESMNETLNSQNNSISELKNEIESIKSSVEYNGQHIEAIENTIN